MTGTSVVNALNEVAQLEAAIRAQESLRPSLGDAVVDATVAALRRQIQHLTTEGPRARVSESEALASLRSHLPDELADKARALGSVEGERKHATVVFADLSGFTAVSEQADPELIRAFQRDLFRDLARIIYQHEGFVEKFVGDAILAVFGAPVAHEDDPERALRVALAMRERMAVLNRTWADRLGTSVTLHVGINTGAVVAGKIGSELGSDGGAYAVTGDTVNSAARLQNAAQPGQILVSRTTYRLARGAFTFRALEPIAVKNRREPLDVYELVRARLLPAKTRGIQELAEAFVGRDSTLRLLETQTKAAVGQAPIVLITGDAGIGKSRLVAEWCKRSGDRVTWLEGRCFTHTQQLPFSPFLDMLRRHAGIVDDDTERRARQRLDAKAAELFPNDTEGRAILANLLAMRLRREEAAFLAKMSARELRARAFDLADRYFGGVARTQRVALFLEDMQWSDQTTLDLIDHLATSQPNLILVFAARRDPESSLAILEAKLASRGERVVRINLEPLDAAATGAMMGQLLSSPDLPRRLAELISEKAEGNPFFVEEIIRTLIERGALQHQGDTWVTTSLLERITVPDTLQGLIMARIDRLPDETKEVVQYAAVIGRTFLYRVLLAIARSSPTLDADLTHLERSEVILEDVRDAEVEYTFRHALTQEMAYESVLLSRRRELHRQVGEATEKIFAGRLGEYYPIVADHYSKGGEMGKAAENHIRAAQQAAQLFTPEAAALFETALSELKQIKSRTAEVKRQMMLATNGYSREILLGIGSPTRDDIKKCLRYLEEVEPLARSLPRTKDDQLALARIYGWMAQAYSMLDDHKNVLTQLAKIQKMDQTLEPEIAARVGQVLMHRGLVNQALAVLKPAINPLVRSNLMLEWIHANGALALAEAASGDYRTGRERAEGGVQRASRLPGPALRALANNYLGATYLMGGEWQKVLEVCEKNEPELKVLGHPTAIAIGHTLWAGAIARQLEFESDANLDPIIQRLDRPEHSSHDQPVLGAWHDAFHAHVRLHARNSNEAQKRAQMAVESAHNRGDLYGEGLALRILGQTLASTDAPDAEQVDDYMRKSRDVLAQGGLAVEEARTLAAWGELQVKRGDPDGKDRLRDALRTFEAAGLSWEATRIRPLI